ncbi:MAG: pilus assembly protein N-terminal domain-containing protein [Deltaproteobacteria bacterium]|nr:pilus assembly protein N-terminal domain-containing protein [Deltaproteobacteria bacterium]
MPANICHQRQPDGAGRNRAERRALIRWLASRRLHRVSNSICQQALLITVYSARAYLQRTSSAGLLALAITALLPAHGLAAEEHVTVDMQAGQTYTLKDLEPNSTPEVTFIDHRPFTLQCPAPSNCVLLGTEAGQGRVRTVAKAGATIIYDVTVTAVAQPGKPLEPGRMPPNTAGEESSAAPTNHHTDNSAAARFAAPTEVALVSEAPSSEKQAQPIRYSQNPVSKELEVPQVSNVAPPASHPPTLALMAGSSRLVNFPVPLRRVSVANSSVADVQVITPNQLMLVGHHPGFTTLVIWDQYGNYYEQSIRIDQGGPEEVQLNVVVAELNRSRLEQQGIDISMVFSNAGVSIVGLPGNVATSYTPQVNLSASGGAGTIAALPPAGVLPTAGTLIPLLLSPSITYGVATQNGQVTTNSFIQLLEQHDLAKILAEPRLIAESGQQAQFLSGGEIPIVISQALNTSIVFKQYGTSVKFVPTVIDSNQGEIELQVRPELSEPDYAQGVELFGFKVPAFVVRRAETRVRLRQSQTLIIAGLILDTNTSTLRKVPYLGDVPFLGAFFRHTYWNHVKSELVMTVTPQIIQPIPAGAQVALPIERGQMTPEEVRTKPLSAPDVTRPRLW